MQDESDEGACKEKLHRQSDNPFIEPSPNQPAVDMNDVMVLNDIIEQAGRQSAASDHGGEKISTLT